MPAIIQSQLDTIIQELHTAPTADEVALITHAYEVAEKAHAGQERNSGEPYFSHVVAVALNCASLGADAETVAAALLHDTIEDTELAPEDIQKTFGDDILFLVQGVTKLGTLKYHGVERHVESMRKFFIALAEDARVLLIKLADRLHNIETLEHVRPDKQHRIAVETIEVYAPLAGRLGMGKLKGLLEDYAFPFAYPDAYQKTAAVMERLVPRAQALMEKLQTELKTTLDTFSISATVQARVKHTYSLYKKLEKYAWDEEKIHDIVALRVLVDTVADCYQVLGLAHMLWKPVPGRIKDWITLPKSNGYKSLHTTVVTDEGVAEIQIRTHEMHDEAEYGIAAHLLYKHESTSKQSLNQKQQTSWLAQLRELSNLVQNAHDIEELKLDFFHDRIFVFTPKGDVIDMPEGASPIDFAYAIHSDIGDRIASVKVNGKMASIETVLKNGDIVEIFTSKQSHPSQKWLGYAKTGFARKKIRSYLEGDRTLAH